MIRCYWCQPRVLTLAACAREEERLASKIGVLETFFSQMLEGWHLPLAATLVIAKVVFTWLSRGYGQGVGRWWMEHQIRGWRADIHGLKKPLQIILILPHPHPSRNHCQKGSRGQSEGRKLSVEAREDLVSCSSLSSWGLEEYRGMYFIHRNIRERNSLNVWNQAVGRKKTS